MRFIDQVYFVLAFPNGVFEIYFFCVCGQILSTVIILYNASNFILQSVVTYESVVFNLADVHAFCTELQ